MNTHLFRAAFDTTYQSIFLVDLTGRVLEANRTALTRIGRARDETLGHVFAEFMPDATAGARVDANIQRVIADRCPIEQEVSFELRSGGPKLTLRGTIRPLFGEHEEMVGVIVEGLDVTAQRAAEQAVLEREAQLRSILDETEVGIFSISADGQRLVYANRTLERIFGRTAEELATPPLSLIRWLHPDDQAEANAVRERRRRGEPAAFDCRLLRPDGETRWIRTVAHPVFGPDGALVRADMLVVDRTEQHLADEALRSSERRFRQLVARGWDVVALIDASGKLLFVSDSVERVLGVKPEVILSPGGWPLSAEMRVALRSVLEEPGGIRSLEVHVQTKDGSHRWLETVLVNLLGDPDVAAIVASSRDVTARKEGKLALANANAELNRRVEEATAELRLTNAALARAARAKDEFLANMSHELRTPLNGVLGLVEALQEHVYGPITDKQRRTLRLVDQSGRHLLALLTDILDLSKIEAGKGILDLEPVSIAEVCRASLAMVDGMAQQKGIGVSAQRATGVPSFRADLRKLKQILVNLLGNAVKFTPEGGQIGLDVTVDPAARQVLFTVWDRGVGIAGDDLPRLFQPFTQIESSLSRANGGSGLGLALVRRLVELHGGRVDVESELGRGSRFTVRLPLRADDEPTAGARDRRPSPVPALPVVAAPNAMERPRILVADDDEMNVSTILDFLRMRGYEIFVARDGRAAVTLAREIRPDVILMDIQMPVLDGLGAIRELRADPSPRVRATPIVALTALAMTGDRERCLEAGADRYMSKPVGLQKLAGLLQELLRARGPT